MSEEQWQAGQEADDELATGAMDPDEIDLELEPFAWDEGADD